MMQKSIFNLVSFYLLLMVNAGIGSAQVNASSGQDLNFSEYWAGSCIQAVSRVADFATRDRLDTVVQMVENDTISTSAKNTAKKCLATLDVQFVKSEHLILLATLNLVVGSDSNVSMILSRKFEADRSSPVEDQANSYSQAIRMYVSAKPSRIADAQRIQKMLDGLTSNNANVAKMLAQRAWLDYYSSIDDDSSSVLTANSIIAIGKKLSQRDRQEFAFILFNAYAKLAEMQAERSGDSAAPLQIVRRAQEDIGAIASLEEFLYSMEATYSKLGQMGGQLSGEFWFGEVGDSIRPSPGKLSIISFSPARINIPAYRRLLKQCPNTEVTFVLRTNGYFRDQGPLEPAQEAEILRAYYFDELNAPGALVISAADVKKLDDGRLVKGKSKNAFAYSGEKGRAGTVIVDPNGIVRRIFSGWTRATEREIAQACAKWGR